VLEGWLSLDGLAAAARLGTTDAILPVMGGGTDVGAVTSAGVGAHNIPAAITALGTSGAGIDVGVISDSIDQVGGGVNTSQASGDLPPDPKVNVLADGDPSDSDEGRAMAEIIFDEAPGLSSILFSSGTATGSVGKAASIDALVANGADVIADDIFYLSEPMFQDGTVSQAVDRAKAANVAYFASAGNRARQSYESTYRDSGSGGLHDFDPGAGTDTRSCFTGTVPTGGFMLISLQWDERWGGATTNLDLRITNSAGTVLASSTTDNIATGIPLESAFFFNGGGAVGPCVEITRVAGAGTPFMKWIEHDNYGPTPVPEFDTASNTINPDAASATGSMSVAAVDVADGGHDTPENFSSRGPNTRFFDAAGNRLASPEVRPNPDLAAADGVATSVPGFSTFFGTSAATPSAAGIAALLRSANPNATVNEVYAQMSAPANAIDCTATAGVPDVDCGAGFILADLAGAALDKTPVVVSLAGVDPATPDGKNGWYTKDVTVTFSVTDPESPIEVPCPPVVVNTDGVQTITCNALSGGGPGTASSPAIMRDAKPPKKPKAKGIKNNQTFSRALHAKPLPPKSKVKCKSSDATSGLDSCKIKGYKKSKGKHTLKLTATDKAGNKSKAKVKYKVT
jgi:hypothetical protein